MTNMSVAKTTVRRTNSNINEKGEESGFIGEFAEDATIVAAELKDSISLEILGEVATEFKGNWFSMVNWILGKVERRNPTEDEVLDYVMIDLGYHTVRVPPAESFTPSVEAKWKHLRTDSLLCESSMSSSSQAGSIVSDRRAARRALLALRESQANKGSKVVQASEPLDIEIESLKTLSSIASSVASSVESDKRAARRALQALKGGQASESSDDSSSVAKSLKAESVGKAPNDESRDSASARSAQKPLAVIAEEDDTITTAASTFSDADSKKSSISLPAQSKSLHSTSTESSWKILSALKNLK